MIPVRTCTLPQILSPGKGYVQDPKVTALRIIEGSHLSVTPQLSAEPPPSCTGPGGGRLGSSEEEWLRRWRRRGPRGRDALEGGLAALDLGPGRRGQPCRLCRAGAPLLRPGGVCRIVYNPGKSQVKVYVR